MDIISDSPANTAEKTNDYKTLYMNASTRKERSAVLLEALKKKLVKVLSAAADDSVDHRCMNSYGTDSLVAVDLKNWIQAKSDVEIAVFNILSIMSTREFAQRICSRSIA